MYDTIFAPITNIGPSAITVFRFSGKESGKILKLLIKEKKLPLERKLVLKNIYFPYKKQILDKSLICWMPNPNSYTGEDSFELHSHGGIATSQAFFSALSKIKGLRVAEAGEFSKRALINGKIDLIKAEAINEIIISETEKQRNLSIKQLNRGLSIPISLWKEQVVNTLAKIEAIIDFSDEDGVPEQLNIKRDLEKIFNQIKKVLKEGKKYDLIKHGTKITFTGPPNSGKSSLFNCIIKKEKSIVTKIPGTTRDVIENRFNLKGYPVIFFDTAGIRNTKSAIEKEGIKKALTAVEEADIVLKIIDITSTKKESKNQRKENEWQIYNKIDKIKVNKPNKSIEKENSFYVSAKTGKGVSELLKKIHDYILKDTKVIEKANFFYTNARQKNDLKKALSNISLAIEAKDEEIIAEYLRATIYNLERILGKVDVEDVLSNIFSNFCVGK